MKNQERNAPAPAVEPTGFDAALADLDRQIETRRQQLEAARLDAEAAAVKRQQAHELRDGLRLAALDDAGARERYLRAGTDQRAADDAAAEADALIEQLVAELERLARERAATVRTSVLAANHDAEQRNTARRAQMRAVIADELAPVIRDLLDELEQMGQRLTQAGFGPDAENQIVRQQTNLGVEVRELLFQVCGSHRFFTRELNRPSRTDRQRLAPAVDAESEPALALETGTQPPAA